MSLCVVCVSVFLSVHVCVSVCMLRLVKMGCGEAFWDAHITPMLANIPSNNKSTKIGWRQTNMNKALVVLSTTKLCFLTSGHRRYNLNSDRGEFI